MNDAYQSGQYKAGVKCALYWIKSGGDLNAPAPDDCHEDFYYGFINTLSDERNKNEYYSNPLLGK